MPNANVNGVNILYSEFGKAKKITSTFYLYMALVPHLLLGEIYQTPYGHISIQ
jgi:hypothetical protein